MPTEPTLHEHDDQNRHVPAGGESVDDLKREIERLRVQLAEATAAATTYRQAAYAMLNERVPYVPPSEDEIRDMLHGPRGPSISSIIDEMEREGEG